MAQRLLNGLDSGTRRTKDYRTRTFFCIFRIEKIAINSLPTAVYLQFHKITIYLIRTIFLSQFLGIFQWTLGQFGLVVVPEFLKVGRHLGVRLNLLWRKPYLHMMLVGFAVDGSRHAAIPETGLFHCAYLDGGFSIFQDHRTFGIGRHHVTSEFIIDGNPVLRNTIFIELDLHSCFFSCFIDPIGMIGYGYPKYIAPVGIVLRQNRKRKHHGKQQRK